MPGVSKRRDSEIEDKRVILLELLAAGAIFSIMALVIYMVFSYRPA